MSKTDKKQESVNFLNVLIGGDKNNSSNKMNDKSNSKSKKKSITFITPKKALSPCKKTKIDSQTNLQQKNNINNRNIDKSEQRVNKTNSKSKQKAAYSNKKDSNRKKQNNMIKISKQQQSRIQLANSFLIENEGISQMIVLDQSKSNLLNFQLDEGTFSSLKQSKNKQSDPKYQLTKQNNFIQKNISQQSKQKTQQNLYQKSLKNSNNKIQINSKNTKLGLNKQKIKQKNAQSNKQLFTSDKNKTNNQNKKDQFFQTRKLTPKNINQEKNQKNRTSTLQRQLSNSTKSLFDKINSTIAVKQKLNLKSSKEIIDENERSVSINQTKHKKNITNKKQISLVLNQQKSVQKRKGNKKSSNKQKHNSFSLGKKNINQQKSISFLNKQTKKSMIQNKKLLSQENEQKWLLKHLPLVKNEKIKVISNQFTNQIIKPLTIQQQLSQLSSDQRCPLHNNIYSLYCSLDRELLCVGCIYQTKFHKSHRVLPLSKATKQITEDIQAFNNRIDQTVNLSQSLLRESNMNVMKIEKQYPALKAKLHKYYSQIIKIVEQKKKQQFQQLQNSRNEMKMQFDVISAQLTKIHNYMQKVKNEIQMIIFKRNETQKKVIIQQKKLQKNNLINDMLQMMKSPTNKKEEEKTKSTKKQKNDFNKNSTKIDQEKNVSNIVLKRCSYQTLSKIYYILTKNSDGLFDDQVGFDVRMKNFNQLLDFLKYKLTMVIPIINKSTQKIMDQNRKMRLFADDAYEQYMQNQGKEKNNNLKEERKKKDNMNIKTDKDEEKNSIERIFEKNKKEFFSSPHVAKGLATRFLQVPN